MGKIQDCAENILSVMIYSDSDEYNRSENILNFHVIDTMLIFLDYEDMIYIISERVIPEYIKRPHKNKDKWLEFLNKKVKEMKEFK